LVEHRSQSWVMTCMMTLVLCLGTMNGDGLGEDEGARGVCRPMLEPVPSIELGDSGLFSWTCSGGTGTGAGYFVVFIRPIGTYVLLKVPTGRSSFEFTPDTAGAWRWVVINTDPDRSRPDVESDQGRFQVTASSEKIR
jgi:hypothetical protein